MLAELRAELHRSHPHDLDTIQRYVTWVRLRRQVHNAFYLEVHWVMTVCPAHWV